MRQMPPAMRRSREGRMTVRATIQGDVLGIKDSEKGAQKSHLVRKRSPGIRALLGADLKSASPAPPGPHQLTALSASVSGTPAREGDFGSALARSTVIARVGAPADKKAVTSGVTMGKTRVTKS